MLEEIGATITWCDDFIACTRGELPAIDMDMYHIPDAAITTATTALFATGTPTLRNIYYRPVNETDLPCPLATSLRKVGPQAAHSHP